MAGFFNDPNAPTYGRTLGGWQPPPGEPVLSVDEGQALNDQFRASGGIKQNTPEQDAEGRAWMDQTYPGWENWAHLNSAAPRDPSAPTDAHTMTPGAPLSNTPVAPLSPGQRFPGDTATWGPNGPPPGVGAAPGATTGQVTPYTGAPQDYDAIDKWFQSMGVTDSKYWTDQVRSKGGINDQGGFWVDLAKSTGAIGGGASGQGQPSGGGTLGSMAGGMAGGMGGDLLQPYTKEFSAPQPGDDPGFEWALKQGQQAIERSAASKGTLLTGGTLKDLAQFTTGAALQDYAGTYNRGLSTFGANYDIFRNNQNDPFNKLLSTSNLGLNAANSYSSALNTNTGYYDRATDPTNSINSKVAGGDIDAQKNLNQGNTLINYAALGTNLLGDWYRGRRSSGLTGNPGGYSS